ncbi:MAG: ribosome small subunit-dependent GTPase A [Oscillospiraceae bacterium]|jgi:ribosome biogenesis GTPase|nr:ribosome small subunit-dependent GTPase A [Oscillospiraceae bacterium]
MSGLLEGRIHNSVGGSYAVATPEGPLVCRARGLFRKQGVTPLVGDLVRVERIGQKEGYIQEILPRKNALARPPLANLDQLFLLCSTAQPRPNLRLLDTLAAVAELAGIEPVIVFTKCDLAGGEDLARIYRAFPCFALSIDSGIEGIRALFQGKTSAFCGNTGVGKSTLLNRAVPELQLPTGEISAKLGRGRHTTRHAELYPAAGGWVADTPGFSALEPLEQQALTKDSLAGGFREFAPHLGECRFPDCAHVRDSGCAVIKAVKAGEIPRSRHESYCALYETLKNKKEWE